MNHTLKVRAAGMLVLTALVIAAPGYAQTSISLGTQNNASHWVISGAGAVNAPAFQLPDTYNISPTNNGLSTGTGTTGFVKANFNGFFRADQTFTIPAGATNVQMTFAGLSADDRVVMQLNGTTVGSMGLSNNGPGNGPGLIRLTENGTDQAWTFSQASGTVTTGFNIGGANTLTLLVNNTGTSFAGATVPWNTTTDGCATGVTATLTFSGAATVPMASPTALAILAALLACFALFAIKRLPARHEA
jgi:hypothetical protein